MLPLLALIPGALSALGGMLSGGAAAGAGAAGLGAAGLGAGAAAAAPLMAGAAAAPAAAAGGGALSGLMGVMSNPLVKMGLPMLLGAMGGGGPSSVTQNVQGGQAGQHPAAPFSIGGRMQGPGMSGMPLGILPQLLMLSQQQHSRR
jgi:hypothetical protein